MERAQYEQNLKQFRDFNNVVTYAEQKGMEKERAEKNLVIIKTGLEEGLPLNLIAKLAKLSISEINEIIKQQDWQKLLKENQ